VTVMDIPILVLAVAGAAVLVAAAVVDARTRRLPDILTLPLIAMGLLAAWAVGLPLWLHVLGAALGYLLMAGLELGYRRVRGRDGLGRGDAKLLAAGGAWCGALGLAPVLLIASASGLLFVLVLRIAGRAMAPDAAIAFGPFLAFGIALVWTFQRTGLWPAAL
jgi:leader peptidase (prepilin peptidase)/N-methyltransferase